MNPQANPAPSNVPPPFLNLTDTQKMILVESCAQLANVLVSMQFNEPEKDNLQLRQHAYLKGQLEGYQSILNYDTNLQAHLAQKEAERIEAALNNESDNTLQ